MSSVKDVINASKKFLPGMAKGFYSPKLTLHVGDGFEFMKKNQDAFDIIITDSSDPVGKLTTPLFATTVHLGNPILSYDCIAGPAESLFKESYYQLMKTALRTGGILCSQGNFIFHPSFVLTVRKCLICKVLT